MFKHFISKIVLYSTPFILAFLFVIVSGIYIGELIPQSIVIQQQLENERIIYETFWERLDMIQYKITAVEISQPDIVILGSSRALQARSMLFNLAPDSVYNAGFQGASIYEIYRFIQILEENDNLPPVLIVSLDLPNFNEDLLAQHVDPVQTIRQTTRWDALRRIRNGINEVAKVWLVKPLRTWSTFVLHVRYDKSLIGLRAFSSEIGYRGDGSRNPSFQYRSNAQAQFEAHLENLANQRNIYAVGQHINAEALGYVQEILEIAHRHNITVVAYWPPFHPDIYAVIGQSDDYSYIPLVKTELSQMFATYGFDILDFSDIETLNGRADEMVDGWHPTELMSARIFRTLYYSHPEIFEPYIDIEQLERDIANAENPFRVYR